MSVMTLFRKSPPESESLFKAPSADLIMSDNELIMPELEDIVCEISAKELAEYIKLADLLGYGDKSLLGLLMLEVLIRAGFRRYNHQAVENFLKKQAECLSRKSNLNISYRWRRITNCGAVPPRVLRNIVKILEMAEANKKEKLLFNISRMVTGGNNIENKKEICFLCVDIVKPGEDWSRYASVIDAWRGPTFSDEEAKI